MKRLILLGGGHAQVQVVKTFASEPPPAASVVLINRSRLTPYSGMVPGLIAGHYAHAACHIDLAWLCAQAGIEFVEQEAIALDPERRVVICSDSNEHAYDLLSIDTGSTPPLNSVPGAVEHAIPVKPIESFLVSLDALAVAFEHPGQHSLAVVGAGAAGFEVVLALDHRFRRQQRSGHALALHLLTDTARVLPGFPARVIRYAERILRERGVQVHTNARASQVDGKGIVLAGGSRILAEHVLFITGAAPGSISAASGLRTDAHGFIAVNAGLQSLSHPNVFASGDVAAVIDHPRPKAGVFAVRQGPPLARNLRRALAGEAPLPYVPQTRYLVLLSTGDKHAIATRGGLSTQGRWVWRWKDWIDRRFMVQFQPPQN